MMKIFKTVLIPLIDRIVDNMNELKEVTFCQRGFGRITDIQIGKAGILVCSFF